ncbi:hypothetical protein OH76DRAFT_174379 [Lentinus brumalis]|uniref:Uncharacterized protein n=1 Tax=Lentinus brumalis TaxID=2498619 RepID=A0A371CNN9_9APHY|nr:hypothetical protein OH76DRAFT_174379 [Polyporus brumalis]
MGAQSAPRSSQLAHATGSQRRRSPASLRVGTAVRQLFTIPLPIMLLVVVHPRRSPARQQRAHTNAKHTPSSRGPSKSIVNAARLRGDQCWSYAASAWR